MVCTSRTRSSHQLHVVAFDPVYPAYPPNPFSPPQAPQLHPTGTLISNSENVKNYLTRLPKRAQKRASAKKGEVEIVVSKKDLDRISSECADELKGSALAGKKIGVLLEDEVRYVVRDALRFPSGETKCEMRVVGKTEVDGPNGVAVLCVLNNRFILREIFRHATRAWELETVRGRREVGTTSQQAARNEVKQELGYQIRKLHKLGSFCPDSAVMSSTLDLFFAELKDEPRHDDPEGSEAFGRIHRLTLKQLSRKILTGEIRDSYTIGALCLSQLKGFIDDNAR